MHLELLYIAYESSSVGNPSDEGFFAQSVSHSVNRSVRRSVGRSAEASIAGAVLSLSTSRLAINRRPRTGGGLHVFTHPSIAFSYTRRSSSLLISMHSPLIEEKKTEGTIRYTNRLPLAVKSWLWLAAETEVDDAIPESARSSPQ